MERQKAEQVIAELKKFFKQEYGESVELPLFDHNHLELSEGSWSTYMEGWYDYEHDMYWTSVVAEEIFEGRIALPEGVYFEIYSPAEMYFYGDSDV